MSKLPVYDSKNLSLAKRPIECTGGIDIRWLFLLQSNQFFKLYNNFEQSQAEDKTLDSA